MSMAVYRINDCVATRQGEGALAGVPAIFLRFTGCNMRCRLEPGPNSPGGFDCDTEFESGVTLSGPGVVERIGDAIARDPGREHFQWVVCTGGEPLLQLDDRLVEWIHAANLKVAVETNGSREAPEGIDWICVSPKVAEHCIRQRTADEVKYVRRFGQGIPKTVVEAKHYWLSPAFIGDQIDLEALAWCEKLAAENPKWKVSRQLHKLAGIP